MHKKIIGASFLFFVLVDALFLYLALTITPVNLKRNRFTYEYGDTISTNPADYFNANDNVLLNVQLNLTAVNDEVGVYKVSATYFTKVFEFEIEIADTVKPKVQLKKVEYDININKKIYAKNMIESVVDKSTTEVFFIDESTNEVTKYKSYAVAGSYIERIVVRDAYGNQSASLRVKITVHDNTVPPVFVGAEDMVIDLYTDFFPLTGVRAIDDLEGDITDRIEASGKVDIEKPGVYKVVYTVSDKAGNTAKLTRKITVKDPLQQ